MKLILVSPPFGEKGQKSKGLPIAPPVLEYLAGLTLQVRPDVTVELVDANKEQFNPDQADADLISFTVLTPQAPWVYRMADRLRQMGRQVLLGGIHVTALPDEAGRHADAIVLGEAEEIWGALLDDAEKRRLKPVYQGGFPELKGLSRPITNLWKTNYVYGYFQTSRGCPHRCTFCSVHEFFGGRVRTRPIDEVVAEIAQSKRRLFWGIDDNVWGVNMDYTIELYLEMGKSLRGKSWFGSGDLVSVDHPRAGELLTNARKAGLTAVLVGWESNNIGSLEEYKAVTKQGRQRRDAIKKIRDHGIEVMLFMMIGGRQDRREDYEGILKLCDELKVSAHPVMTTPFPGTQLYELYKPYLVPGLDWDSFDGNHAVFTHDDPLMSIDYREEAIVKLRAELFTIPRILGRIPQISWRGFPMSHITSWMIQYPQGRAFTQFAREREALKKTEAPG
ncbi:radical SAM domain iron-sulfur cluster-binding oxidoreductase with cobamide-binding-like domain [Geotalea daltonii FRC-32]|uniref:Radical SAM domain iron-sulfur cluster-binding oxidoreductase with cobamide-binding-like domain n=1 Tax=Geotalea daltonii (strain DSM 22248 / JCM 15807 / FRC-32) TaxID=316067 RepID=B9M7X7_GEODF|nr:radical SAM protein [Geotalea daltonii]ACM18435.1 radical SAM domain iron-sulfur cluster-binding oxidoreductase with cobamide-binding-like domain [Geotalea daltonii FRC-32]